LKPSTEVHYILISKVLQFSIQILFQKLTSKSIVLSILKHIEASPQISNLKSQSTKLQKATINSSLILQTGSLTSLLKNFPTHKKQSNQNSFSHFDSLPPNQAGGPHERAVYETPFKPLIVA
jgi:hypothetical protein